MSSEREHNGRDVDEHLIPERFSQLTGDDGSPDVSLRQANLRNLVNSLSAWELIYLRSLVRDAPATLADVSDLPEELVATISAQLDYRDVINCTQVSRGWRRAWTADLVVKDVARAHFSGLIESSSPEASPWSLFRPVAAKAIARSQGKCISFISIATQGSPLLGCAVLKLDDRSLEHAKYNPSPAEPIARASSVDRHRSYYGYAYCNGKIAWQWDAYSFFMDDIRAMTRTYVSPSDLVVKGEKDFIVSAMSDKLLILVNIRTQRALIVYHLEKDQYRRVTLPSRMHEINPHKETFVVTFNKSFAGADPHFWRWEGGLVKLKVPDFPEIPLDLDEPILFEHLPQSVDCNMRSMFHPARNDLLFLVTIFLVRPEGDPSDIESDNSDSKREPTRKAVVKVHKFCREKYVETFSYENILTDPSSPLRLSLRCQPMNSHGLYNLVLLLGANSVNAVYRGPPGSRLAKTPNMTISRINFNTVTETFSYDTGELKGMYQLLENEHARDSELAGCILWNDLVYYAQNGTAEDGDDALSRRKDTANNPDVRVLCLLGKSSTLAVDEYSLWVSGRKGFLSIEVDDDFLVANSDSGYAVWNFGDFDLREKPWVRNHERS